MNTEDQILVDAIKSNNDRKRNWALYSIYSNARLKDYTRNYILNHGGLEADVEDIFQEAIILLDRNLRNEMFKGDSALGTYFIAIVKWKWLGIQRKKKIMEVEVNNNLLLKEDTDLAFAIISEERKKILDYAIEKLGAKCKELLAHYKLDHTMKEIAVILGYSSPEMAKKQAYRCREKLKEFFTNHKEYREVFFNN